MSEFGELLRQVRGQCRDPQNGKPLTQEALAERLCLICDIEGYSGATISNWERGKNQIRRDDRLVLVGLMRALHETGGLPTSGEADRLLLAGNYRPLDEAERQRINPAWKHRPDPGENWLAFPSAEEQCARLPLATYTNLIGVETVIAEILDLLTAEKAPYLVMLAGLGGLGKTAVADAVAQEAIQRGAFAQVIWVAVDRAPTAMPADSDIFMRVLAMLGEQLLPDKPPETNPHKLLSRVRSKLNRHRCLIVIDNLEDREQTNRLIGSLQGLVKPSKFLLTARHYPPPDSDTTAFHLQELPREAALALFRQQAEIGLIGELAQISADMFADIYRVVGGHPQALRLIPQLVRRYPLAQVMADWQERGAGYIEQVYDSIYTALWQELQPSEKRLLAAMLSVAQVGAAPEHMRFVSDLPRHEFWPSVTKLVELCLLEPRGTAEDRRYGVHSLTVNFLQTHQDAIFAQYNAGVMVPKHIVYWRSHLEKLPPDRWHLLDIERHHIFRAVRDSLALKPEEITPALQADRLIIADVIFRFVEQRGYANEWRPILQMLTTKVEMDRQTHCHLLLRLGEIHRLTFAYSEAMIDMQEALQLAISINDESYIARSHFHLGTTLYQLRQYEQAEQHGRTALDFFIQANLSEKESAATHNLLGITYLALSDFNASSSHLQQAAAVWRAERQYPELARTLNNLARTWQAQGRYDEAFNCFQEAKQSLASTASKLDRVLILLSEGSLYFDLGRYGEAEAIFTRIDLAYLREINHLHYQALTLNNLGNVLLVRQEYLKAETVLQECFSIWRQMGDEIEAADTLGLLADAAWGSGERETAVSLCQEAMVWLNPYTGQPDAEQVVQEILRRLAEWGDM